MYADREEAALAERKKRQDKSTLKRAKQRRSWSYSSSVSRSVSPSRSRSRSRSPPPISPRRPGDVGNRERELQEQLRKRAMMSKRTRSTVNPSSDQISSSPDAQDEYITRAKATSSRSPDRHQKRTKERSERRQGRRDLLDRRSEDRSDDEGRRSSKRHKSRRDSIHDESREEEESSRSRRRRKERDYDDEFDRRSSNRDGESRHGGDSESGSHHEKRDRRARRSSRASEDDSARKNRRSNYHPNNYYDSPRSNGGDSGGYYDSYYGRYDSRYPPHAYYEPYRYDRSPSPQPRRRHGESRARSPDFDDYEMRSIFCSQLAARLTQRDLGEYFEDKLGEGTVMDVKIVMDKVTGRSKGVGYVELKDEPLVEKALGLSGTVLFGIPIIVQKTDAARNKGGEASSAAGAPARPNLPAALSALSSEQAANLPKLDGNPIHIDPGNIPSVAARLYVGNLHFSLTEADIKSVFEPFGAILSVDLHREPGTLKSKGFAFVQFINTDVAGKAIEHMNGFELAGRNIKVNHVNSARASGTVPSTSSGGEGDVLANASNQIVSDSNDISGAGATLTSSFDEGGGGGLTASSRAALMEKLARIDRQSEVSDAANANLSTEQSRPSNIPQAESRGVHLKNMFNPEEETERGWEVELAEDIKEECQQKYGKVDAIKVDINSMGEVYIRFADVEGAQKAVQGLNGRFFGGRSISAAFISEGFLVSMLS